MLSKLGKTWSTQSRINMSLMESWNPWDQRGPFRFHSHRLFLVGGDWRLKIICFICPHTDGIREATPNLSRLKSVASRKQTRGSRIPEDLEYALAWTSHFTDEEKYTQVQMSTMVSSGQARDKSKGSPRPLQWDLMLDEPEGQTSCSF
jgi:hypothetical protein